MVETDTRRRGRPEAPPSNSGLVLSAHHPVEEVPPEDGGNHVHEPVDLSRSAPKHCDDYIGHESSTYPIRDAVREGHHANRKEGRNADAGIAPVDVLDDGHHEVAHDDEYRSC